MEPNERIVLLVKERLKNVFLKQCKNAKESRGHDEKLIAEKMDLIKFLEREDKSFRYQHFILECMNLNVEKSLASLDETSTPLNPFSLREIQVKIIVQGDTQHIAQVLLKNLSRRKEEKMPEEEKAAFKRILKIEIV